MARARPSTYVLLSVPMSPPLLRELDSSSPCRHTGNNALYMPRDPGLGQNSRPACAEFPLAESLCWSALVMGGSACCGVTSFQEDNVFPPLSSDADGTQALTPISQETDAWCVEGKKFQSVFTPLE
ncbi:Gametocyte-Specific Factor 1-Like [Manis pentadactyla]|nr:Gametocyte-Specific Factor 1-Like [Manis pentadactyla]